MKLIRLLFAVAVLTAATAAQAVDLSKSMILVAKPELVDQLYGSTILVVTPVGGDRHAGFIVNRPTNVTLGQLFPEDSPSRKVVDPVYLGGPLSQQVIFALVERKQSPSGQSFELMPGLHVAVDEETVDRIMRTESDHARFVAGLVVWQRGELRARDRARRVVRAAARRAPGAAEAQPDRGRAARIAGAVARSARSSR